MIRVIKIKIMGWINWVVLVNFVKKFFYFLLVYIFNFVFNFVLIWLYLIIKLSLVKKNG